MAKKVTVTFSSRIWANTEQGGAWIAEYSVDEEGIVTGEYSAWKNASAAKRWMKAKVQALTPRKSIKLLAGTELDAKGKPTSFTGTLIYKK
jgi:hypothetical protein